MSKRTKIVFLGAGSAIFTERLVADLIRQKDVGDCYLVMHDIDKKVLGYMTAYTRMMVKREKSPVKIDGELSRAKAFDGADFVLVTLTIGGGPADLIDVEAPAKYGIVQPVGDTLGPGGLMRIFRMAGPFTAFAADMEKYCPHAMMINYSNPMTMLCRLVSRVSKVKVVGLCHGTWGTLGYLGPKLGIPPAEIEVLPAGVNHFIWFLRLRHKGRDLNPLLRKVLIDEGKGADRPVSTELFRIYGSYPSPGDRHLVEFLPYYLKDEATRKKYNLALRDNRATDRYRHEGRKACREVVEGKRPLPDLKASGERAMHIIASVVNNKNEVHYANIPNKGYIRNLPDDVIVEVPTRFGRKGAVGEKVGDLPLGIHSHVVRIVGTQELGVEAALTGDYRLALQAFLSDSIVTDVAVAEKMLKDMFRRSRKWLTQFRQ